MHDEDGVHGPVDYLVLELPNEAADGGIATAVLDLVDRGIIRLYDVMVVRCDTDGSVVIVDMDELTGELTVLAGARSGLVGEDDLEDVAGAIRLGYTAAVLLYENVWARPVVAAVRRAGAEVVASARIPADELMKALDGLDAASADA